MNKNFNHIQRAAMMLLFILLTATTAWAQPALITEYSIGVQVLTENGGSGTVTVHYVNSDGAEVTEDYSNGGMVSTSRLSSEFTLYITPAAGCEMSEFYRTLNDTRTDLTATENDGVYTYSGTFPQKRYPITIKFAPTSDYWFINFIANGGSGTMDAQAIPKGETANLSPITFTHADGWFFAGWDTESINTPFSTTYADGESITPNRNLTLYAQWTDSYTLHFDANGGSGTMDDLTITINTVGNLNANTFTCEGYSFMGWNTKADGSGTSYADGADISELLATGKTIPTLYAQWKNCFFVHFDANGSTGTMADQAIERGYHTNLNANAFTYEEGYVFTGWNTEADGSGTSYADGEMVINLALRGQTITLYAQWSIFYTVHFNANGGEGTMADQTFIVGQKQALAARTFTRTGYFFAGWNTRADGYGTNYGDMQIVTNMTNTPGATVNLYAQWKKTATVVYMDASGYTNKLYDCQVISPDYMPTTLSGNYYVSESVTYTSKVTLSSPTTIVLANGKTMSIGTEAAPLSGDYALHCSGNISLTIYSQTLDAAKAGSLEAYSSAAAAVLLSGGNYAQHSGNVKVINSRTSSSENAAFCADGGITIDGGTFLATVGTARSSAIRARYGSSITISGGNVTANATGADSYGMSSSGNITLTWNHASDRITANSYHAANGTVSLSKRFAFDDGGTVTLATTDNMGGKTLRPAALVTFDTNGGSNVAAQPVFIGTAATAPTTTRKGYNLSGWTLGGAAYNFATTVNGDITLTAQWTDMFGMANGADGSADHPYVISTADGWNYFCDALQDNDTWNRFSGMTVKLDKDIEVSQMAGSDDHEFMGNFNGGGNTLTFTATATGNYCSPFANVQGGSTANNAITISNLNVKTTITAADYRHAAGLIALQSGHVNVTGCNATVDISSTGGTNNPTDLYPAGLISQAGGGGVLTVTGCSATGTISTDGKYAAGLVGVVQGAASISDCVSSVTINSSIKGDGTHGGIVAVVTGSGTITGCVFSGKLLTVNTGETATGNCAGFIAWGNGTISNCLYAPATILEGETEVVAGTGSYPSGTFYRGTAPTVSNCYYTRQLGTAQGTVATVYMPATAEFVPQNVGDLVKDYGFVKAYTSGLKYDGRFYLVPVTVSLADNTDNTAVIIDKQVADVRLTSRKLYKDGAWNTLCLPFGVTISGSPLDGAEARCLCTATLADGTLTLNFSDPVNTLVAGTPYIIKWNNTEGTEQTEGTEDIVSPTFSSVTIDATDRPFTSTDQKVTFRGTYAPIEWYTENNSILFLGAANTLYYPQPSGDKNPGINACRAYFELSDGQQAREFRLNFGDGEASSINEELRIKNEEFAAATEWHTLDGRRLAGKPTKSGVYVSGGRKIVVK